MPSRKEQKLLATLEPLGRTSIPVYGVLLDSKGNLLRPARQTLPKLPFWPFKRRRHGQDDTSTP